MVCYLFIERKPIGICSPNELAQLGTTLYRIHFFYSTLSKANVLRKAHSLAGSLSVYLRPRKRQGKTRTFVFSIEWTRTRQQTRRKSRFLSAFFLFLGWWMTTCFVSLLVHSTLALLLNSEHTHTHTPHAHRRRGGFRHRHFSSRTRRCEYENNAAVA